MSEALPREAVVAVVGAGAMGAGIAQIAATAGHPVLLYDLREGAAESAVASIRRMLDKLLGKQKISAGVHERALHNLVAAQSLSDCAKAALVVEAIVEKLEVKQEVFKALEGLVEADAILATNTSSISVTSIGAALTRPERLAGMHFFNPAPLMKLVEVISGLATSAQVADTVFATAAAWGKHPVHAKSTPGFIVNRVARPFYAEALRLVQEGVSDPATLDALMREAGGFRMGPFQLMDMIGHDVNFAVTRSVFDAYYGDPRFSPSLIQQELVNAGFLGRKSGRGFFDYRDGAVSPSPQTEEAQSVPTSITLIGDSDVAAAMAERLSAAGLKFASEASASDAPQMLARLGSAVLMLSDGRTATQLSAETGHADVAVLDLMLDPTEATRCALSFAGQCSGPARAAVIGLLQAAGFAVTVLKDSPGLLILRTVSMLANEACDAVHQQVCTSQGADMAMKGGVGYPIGPLEWADRVGPARILGVLEALSAHYGETRYRASPFLRQQVWSGRDLRD